MLTNRGINYFLVSFQKAPSQGKKQKYMHSSAYKSIVYLKQKQSKLNMYTIN